MQEVHKVVLNHISEGIIVIDNKGIITSYNDRAKDIFGIFQPKVVKHSEGKIQYGDMVFIVDNKIGIDDGNLTYNDLRALGIYDEKLSKGDSLLAFGIYGSVQNNSTSIYKRVIPQSQQGRVSLEGQYLKHRYVLEIDYNKKLLKININNKEFPISFEKAAGHMVIMRANKLVFCQQRGYTARSEDLKRILNGASFREKGGNAQELNPIGKYLFDIHEKNEEMNKFYKAAVEEDRVIVNEVMNINGISTISSIIPLYINDYKYGAMIKIEDVTELKKVMEERNLLLQSLKEKEEVLKEDEILNCFKSFEGISRHIRATKLLAYKCSKTNSTVLILGESGIGKSTLAKEIHELSERKRKKFVHLNCASLPEGLLESELFGYEGGSFTHSKKGGKVGLLELADGGTLFLDEIGEMSLKIQAKLLNFLQQKTFYRVGGVEEIKVDTRIICATNKNLEEEIIFLHK